eukprot:TRINITY_DN10268_c0_g2_i1.p1 TRINITY_DN10268_c0_g2~~TRINITY_DN10268_c0_g2_i1.p1  ORF type:complete len:529 (+),score=139.66 TRINITY_DN10268_c0_g2_i1:163-1749(+)
MGDDGATRHSCFPQLIDFDQDSNQDSSDDHSLAGGSIDEAAVAAATAEAAASDAERHATASDAERGGAAAAAGPSAAAGGAPAAPRSGLNIGAAPFVSRPHCFWAGKNGTLRIQLEGPGHSLWSLGLVIDAHSLMLTDVHGGSKADACGADRCINTRLCEVNQLPVHSWADVCAADIHLQEQGIRGQQPVVLGFTTEAWFADLAGEREVLWPCAEWPPAPCSDDEAEGEVGNAAQDCAADWENEEEEGGAGWDDAAAEEEDLPVAQPLWPEPALAARAAEEQQRFLLQQLVRARAMQELQQAPPRHLLGLSLQQVCKGAVVNFTSEPAPSLDAGEPAPPPDSGTPSSSSTPRSDDGAVDNLPRPAFLDPKMIRFSQDKVREVFGSGKHKGDAIAVTARLLTEKRIKVGDFPRINVFRWPDGVQHEDGIPDCIFTADNRRLWVFREAGAKRVPVRWVHRSVVDPSKMSTTCSGAMAELASRSVDERGCDFARRKGSRFAGFLGPELGVARLVRKEPTAEDNAKQGTTTV